MIFSCKYFYRLYDNNFRFIILPWKAQDTDEIESEF